jgi:Xaa-Pro aminopeptidase
MMQALPFSAAKLDALLDQSGADALLASSKHNVQYLLGGYRYFFFEHSAAIGLGHYLPVMGYVKGREDLAFYGIVDSMLATFHWVRPGATETQIVQQLRVEQTLRGLDYEFALITTGPTFGRGPSPRMIANREILSLDTRGAPSRLSRRYGSNGGPRRTHSWKTLSRSPTQDGKLSETGAEDGMS